MKKKLAAFLALLLLTGCSPQTTAQKTDDTLRVLCTTYPVYLFTTAVTEGVQGIRVSLLVNSQTSCLHDYTLTVNDMKAIETADVIIKNGAGLEEFMDNALSHANAAVIDCSKDVRLLASPEDDQSGHIHASPDSPDPHIWMDPNNAKIMVENIRDGLAATDRNNDIFYRNNAEQTVTALEQSYQTMTALRNQRDETAAAADPDATRNQLITFHDGFQYLANAFGFTLLKAIEEEEGATASAAEMQEIVELIDIYQIPAIFTERNGSTATAQAIAAETGCAVRELDMIMSGDGVGISSYLDTMNKNLNTILEALT